MSFNVNKIERIILYVILSIGTIVFFFAPSRDLQDVIESDCERYENIIYKNKSHDEKSKRIDFVALRYKDGKCYKYIVSVVKEEFENVPSK